MTRDFVGAVLRDGSVRLERHTLPPRGPGEIDVAVTLAAVCGSDLHTVAGRRPAAPGTGLGHEAVGRILDVDDDACDAQAMPLQVGDRVVFGMIVSCGRCDRCTSGLTMKCRTLLKYGHASVDEPPHAVGMLADVVRLVPGVTVLRAPDLPDELLVSSACAVPTAAALVAALGEVGGRRIGVIGAGAVGTYVAAMLVDAGAEVLLMEKDDMRAGLADARIRSVDRLPAGLDAVVEVSGTPEGTLAALAACDVGGTVVLAGTVSPGAADIELDPADIVLRCLRVVGVHNYAPDDLIAGVAWLERRGMDAPHVVGREFGLAEVDRAIESAMRRDALRVAVRPGMLAGGSPVDVDGGTG